MERFPFTPDQFHPDLIHRIILSDDEDISNLTLSGVNQSTVDRNPKSFSSFVQNHGIHKAGNNRGSSSLPTFSIADQIASTMREAFFEQIHDHIIKENNFTPFRNMLSELHTEIRKLVPRRIDLHSYLDDESIKEENLKRTYSVENSSSSLIEPIIKAGEALAQLEAPDQVDATSTWIETAKSSIPTFMSNHNIDIVRFAILSTAYLLQKTDFCHTDIQNVRLRQILAPKLRMNNCAIGITWERYYFQRLHGSFDSYLNLSSNTSISNNDDKKISNTQRWIQEQISSTMNFSTFSKIQKKQALKSAIVDSIIFSSSTKPKPIPEIFILDSKSFSSIRKTAQLSVVGSALALHCCIAAGIVLPQIESGQHLKNAHTILILESIKKERDMLTKAMAQGRGPDGNEVTPMLKEAILTLVDSLISIDSSSSQPNFKKRPKLDENEQDALLRRSAAVLCGTDPVFKLLDKRIRSVFSSMIIWNQEESTCDPQTPTMRTGHTNPSLQNMSSRAKAKRIKFNDFAFEYSCRNGFSIYAHDLANAGWNLKKIGDNMTRVYWDPFLEKLVANLEEEVVA